MYINGTIYTYRQINKSIKYGTHMTKKICKLHVELREVSDYKDYYSTNDLIVFGIYNNRQNAALCRNIGKGPKYFTEGRLVNYFKNGIEEFFPCSENVDCLDIFLRNQISKINKEMRNKPS